MKFRKGDWKIDSSSLVDLEWRKGIPRLIVHEKYEKRIKWALRILTLIGIATSVITLPWYWSLSLAIVLLGIEQFFERAIFEYTTMIVQPMPPFEIDGKRWKTMGFLFPHESNADAPPVIGPAFDNEEYARSFFDYIQSWNAGSSDDPQNNVIFSIVREPNSTYTVFLYANPKRKHLDKQFKNIEEQRKYEKKGKRHQQLIMQVSFIHNFEYRPDMFIHKFLSTYSTTDTYLLSVFVTNAATTTLKPLQRIGIKKYSFKINRREDLTPGDPEYHTKIDGGY